MIGDPVFFRDLALILVAAVVGGALAWRAGQPSSAPMAEAREIDSSMPSGAPTMATHFTRKRSRRDSSIPIENMSRITPISANSSNRCASLTAGPGVNGLSRRPPRT